MVTTALLEALAVAGPGGFFSSAFAPALALAAIPGSSPVYGALGLLAGTVIRFAFSGSRAKPLLLLESLADLAPALAGLAGVACLTLPQTEPTTRALAGILPFLVLGLGLAPRGRATWHRTLHYITVGLLGPVLVRLQVADPLSALWLLPVLVIIHRTAHVEVMSWEASEREALESAAQESRTAAQVTRKVLADTSQALQREATERHVLEKLSHALADCREVAAAAEVLVGTIRSLLGCRKVALLEVGEGRRALSSSSPPSEEVWALAEISARSGQIEILGETATLPLQRELVLLIEPFQEGQLGLLRVMAGAGRLGLQSAQRFESQQEALEQYARAHARLKVWVDRLAFLLDGARSLAAGLSVEEVRRRLEQLLTVTLPHSYGAIVTDKTSAWGPWPDPTVLQCPPTRPSPLLLMGAEARRLGPQAGSAMVCPLLADSDCLGWIWLVQLGSEQEYTGEHLDTLCMLSYQAAVALRNASLHQEVLSAQARLVQSSKMAAVGQLAAGVAHELNSPLCASLLCVQMATEALEGGRQDQVLSRLAKAERNQKRCQEIIAKLLYYSREGAKERTEIELGALVKDTLELFGGQLALEKVELGTNLAADLPPVRVNAGEIQQLLTNLLLNARDAVLGQSSPRVAVSTRRARGRVEVAVWDSGPGIPREVQDRMFEPFFTTKPVGQGTGLGLWVSREIAASHEGTLEICSEPGRGTEVVLSLPCKGGPLANPGA